MEEKMHNIKKGLVSFLTIAFIFFLAATISAADIATIQKVEVDGINALTDDVSVVAGERVTVKVYFTSDVGTPDLDESDVNYTDGTNARIEVVLEGEREDVQARTEYFDIEEGKSYVKTLTIRVPYELKDEVSEDLSLDLKIWNVDFRTEDTMTLRVQRPSYNANIFTVNTDRTVKAGELIPVDVVLKNRGYNNLDDLEVTVKVPELGLEKKAYFGDLVSIENPDDEDDVDTVSGRVYLRLPFDAEEGIYTLEVEVFNDDTVSSEVVEIMVENELPSEVIKTSGGLLFVNPTNSLKAYRVVTPENERIVTIPAGLSKEVEITPTSEDYSVTVLTMNGNLVESFGFEQVSGQEIGSTVVMFTVILAIVFLVLLIVLIVLVTRKPQRTEELGESYY